MSKESIEKLADYYEEFVKTSPDMAYVPVLLRSAATIVGQAEESGKIPKTGTSKSPTDVETQARARRSEIAKKAAMTRWHPEFIH
jgi:hypothetical protein